MVRSRSLALQSHAHCFANTQLSPRPWFPPSLDGLVEVGKKANLLPNRAQVKIGPTYLADWQRAGFET